MNLYDEILADRSKEHIREMAAWVGHHPERIRVLIDLLASSQKEMVQRAAWIISYVAEAHPEAVCPYLPTLAEHLNDSTAPTGLRRNVMRVMQFLPIPENLHDIVLNHAFNFLQNEKETVAVRAFSMTVIQRISVHYPELRNELKLILAHALAHQELSPGFINRAKKILVQSEQD